MRTNFDAKTRRNSTDQKIILLTLPEWDLPVPWRLPPGSRRVALPAMLKERYFIKGKGKEFEEGRLSLEDLRQYAISLGKEPAQISGKQELYESIVNMYI